jgi:hypothetical protein
MFMKRFLVSCLPFGLIVGSFFAITSDARSGAVVGALAGVIFGLLVAVFTGSRWLREATRPELGRTERVLKDGPATRSRGLTGAGGWLFLTDDRLTFKPHALNVSSEELSIPLADIVEARPALTAGLVPNGLEVRVEGGRAERFAVEGRRAWSEQIMSACRGIAVG